METRKIYRLKHPKTATVETEAGPITLLIGEEAPEQVFVEIEGELRKVIDMPGRIDIDFDDEGEWQAFLERLARSRFFEEQIVGTEKAINRLWSEL